MSGLPYLNMSELAAIFGYTNLESLRFALNSGRLPLPTYKIRGQIVADAAVVNAFFEKKRAEGLAELNREPSGS